MKFSLLSLLLLLLLQCCFQVSSVVLPGIVPLLSTSIPALRPLVNDYTTATLGKLLESKKRRRRKKMSLRSNSSSTITVAAAAHVAAAAQVPRTHIGMLRLFLLRFIT